MSKTTCQIYFDNNPSRVFYGGQLLSGRVVLKLFKEKTVRGIYVKIIGRAYCEWTATSRHSTRSSRRETYTGEEYYLNEKTFFVGGDSGEIDIPIGEYNYTFSCVLPAALPTSVEGHTGYIRYSAIVNLDRPMWPDQEFHESFTVIKPLNLNNNIKLRYPLVKEVRKTFFICCLIFCVETSPVCINARIPVAGYAPGQTIELFLEIDNKSDQTFENFNIQILKHIQYYTHANSSVTTFDTIIVNEKICGGCLKNQAKSYNLNVVVPPVPPTDLSTSNIVKVCYLLRIRGTAGCFRRGPILDLPITIGTYPIQLGNVLGQNSTITQQPTQPLAQYTSNNYGMATQLPEDSFNSTPYPSAPSCSTVPNAEDIDPPTYEKALSGCSVHVNGKVFRPSYPVFRRTPSYSTESTN